MWQHVKSQTSPVALTLHEGHRKQWFYKNVIKTERMNHFMNIKILNQRTFQGNLGQTCLYILVKVFFLPLKSLCCSLEVPVSLMRACSFFKVDVAVFFVKVLI